MNWGEQRAQARRLLDDTTVGKYRWNDTQLLDYVGWALNALCAHTALATASSFTAEDGLTSFSVPSNAMESVNLSGMIYLKRGTKLIYANPVKYNVATRMGTSSLSFYLMPERTVNFNLPLQVGDEVNLFYFAYYPHPTQDSDEILSPDWSVAAVNYLIASHAFSPQGGRSAQIRQWGQKPDTGNPEDNSLQNQSQWYLTMANHELARWPRQDRRNYFRTG